MTPEEIYLDLSKLSEEQQRKVIALLPYKKFHNQYQITKLHFILWFDEDNKWWIYGTEIKNKTELTYSQFLDMMGESEEKSKVIENSEKELINNDGTLYIGEGLENYYKDQLERTGKFKVVAIDATSEEVLQVENNGWIKILSETDLPKEEDEFWVFENNEVTKTKRQIGIDNNDYWWLNNITHYQPLIKPLPPKF